MICCWCLHNLGAHDAYSILRHAKAECIINGVRLLQQDALICKKVKCDLHPVMEEFEKAKRDKQL